ncbi:hypothetical protein [Paenibacillus xylanexedens]|uniref:Uncharacterized protein n=2 Tax=Paenibacillus xylanexedens TaxID=528191 RepID=A0ABS4S141_PAEXY|nr:hypothetical protein [Paenibacillus xylanexedens]MBP2247772.1 hypothetical protein [Paenibacillus xylanexedens]
MHVIEFQGPDAKPVGSKAAGNPVAPISEMLEAKTLLVNNRPVLLATGPYVLATAHLMEQDALLWHEQSAGLYRWNQLHAVHVQDRMLEPSGLLLYKVQPNEGEKAEISGEKVTSNELRTRLLEFRVELCKAGLEQVRRHLSVRISGGQSTFQHQLVKGMVADILTTLYMAETLPEDRFLSANPGLPSVRVHAWIHQELDEAFRQIQRLGGGFGFLRHGVSAYTYAGQLVKNMLLPAKEEYS